MVFGCWSIGKNRRGRSGSKIRPSAPLRNASPNCRCSCHGNIKQWMKESEGVEKGQGTSLDSGISSTMFVPTNPTTTTTQQQYNTRPRIDGGSCNPHPQEVRSPSVAETIVAPKGPAPTLKEKAELDAMISFLLTGVESIPDHPRTPDTPITPSTPVISSGAEMVRSGSVKDSMRSFSSPTPSNVECLICEPRSPRDTIDSNISHQHLYPKPSPPLRSIKQIDSVQGTSFDSGISSTISAPQQSTPRISGGSLSQPLEVNVHANKTVSNGKRLPPTLAEKAELDEMLSFLLTGVESIPDHPRTPIPKAGSELTRSSSVKDSVRSVLTPTPSNVKCSICEPKMPSTPRSPVSADAEIIRCGSVKDLARSFSSPTPSNTECSVCEQKNPRIDTVDSFTSHRHPHHKPSPPPRINSHLIGSERAMQEISIDSGISSTPPRVRESQENPIKRSYVMDEPQMSPISPTRSVYDELFGETSHLSWLEKQQLKLKVKKEGRGTIERQEKERRMLAELNMTLGRRRFPSEGSQASLPASLLTF